MNFRSIKALYLFELSRAKRTIFQGVVGPVISTTLYFIVFGSAIGSRMTEVDGISYGAYIVPGLIMLTVLNTSVSTTAFGIFFPKFTGTIYEILSAPMSYLDIIVGYVGGTTTKAMVVGGIILVTSTFFVPLEIRHPFVMILFLFLTCITFSLLGFIVGVWADNFERLQMIPLLVITPLTFLGGSFYSISMLPPFWQKVSLLNPVVYLVSGFRWSFYESADVSLGASLTMIGVFLAIGVLIVSWVFKTGYRLKP